MTAVPSSRTLALIYEVKAHLENYDGDYSNGEKLGEVARRVQELEAALENLAGDVYLFGLGEFGLAELLDGQTKALAVLAGGAAEPADGQT